MLPVELLYFNAETEESEVNLRWGTASETNNEVFILERASDGIHFTELARIKGNGTTNEVSNYSFMDINPAIGANYYRLIQVDYNGAFEIFETVLVFFEAVDEMVIYPNPVVEKINVQYGTKFIRTSSELTISSITGEVIWHRSMFLSGSRLEIYIDELPSGTYLFELKNEASH